MEVFIAQVNVLLISLKVIHLLDFNLPSVYEKLINNKI